MPRPLYQEVYEMLDVHVDKQVDEASLERLVRLVIGMIEAESASPAQIACALKRLGLDRGAKIESIERGIRRTENDPEIDAVLCVHPFARWHLAYGEPQDYLLIIDPTYQDDRIVMVTVSVWYRGRALPLAWEIWPANVPLEGDGFWARTAALLDIVAGLLPENVPVTILADRAFGSPSFIDLVAQYEWDYVVRVQGQTKCKDRIGREYRIDRLVSRRRQRQKMRGEVFKKRGWREASVVVYWGRRHKSPLCLVSSLPPEWALLQLYRRRYPIEAMFRDYKSAGWQWERGQVLDRQHVERLLVGMALATWIAVLIGTQVAAEYLAQPPTGNRRTVPWAGKRSLFNLGLQRLKAWFHQGARRHWMTWQLSDWDAPNWSQHLYFHHVRAFVFALRTA